MYSTAARLLLKPARWPVAVVFVVVAAAYAAGSAAAFTWFGAIGIGMPVFFPPAGLTLGALLVVGRRRWPVVLAAAGAAELIADLAQGLGPAGALGFALANTLEPLAGALLLRGVRVDLGRREGLARFLLGPVLLAPVVGAVVGATAEALFVKPIVWLDVALRWWVGDSLGVLVVGGVILAFLSPTAVGAARTRRAETMALLVLTSAVLATALWAQVFTLLYAVGLLLVWAAFRIGVLGVSLTGTCVAVLSALATATEAHLLPQLGFAPPVSLLYVQLLIVVVIATMMAFGVEVGEREQTLRRFTAIEAAAAAERAAHRGNELLARVTTALGHATTIDETIGALHDHGLVPVGATGSSMGVMAEDGRLRVVTRGFPATTAARFASIAPDAPLPGPAAIRGGRALYLATRADTRRLFPAASQLLDGAGYQATAVLPLHRAGTTVGYLGVHFAAEREFGHAERLLLEAMAVQVAHTLERARLFEAAIRLRELAEHRAERERLRNDVTVRIAAASDLPGQLQGLADALVPAMADFATVEIPTPGGAPQLVAAAHVDPERLPDLRRLRDRYALVPAETNVITRCLATGEPELLERIDPATIAEHSPDPATRALLTALAPCSYAAVPLATGGTVVGAVVLGYSTSGRHYEPGDVQFLQNIATEAALAVENARLHRTEHRVAETLQRSLLPTALPTLPRLGLAALYLPATEGTRAGGDWYDVLDLDAHTVAIVVGDVVGHGPAAAAVMGQLRSALTAYLLQGHSPATALGWLTRFARRVPGAPASTAIAVVIDTDTRELRWARAGHPPPLVVDPSGGGPGRPHASYLVGAEGAVLGVKDPPPFTEGRTVLAPGASVLLYTDGLVERRGETIDDGLDRLAAAVVGANSTPSALIDTALAGTLGGTGPNDDVALIVARLRPAPLELRAPAVPAQLAGIRRAVAAWAATASLSEALTDDLQLVLGEATANAAEHAYPDGTSGEIRISVRERDDHLRVDVGDDGRWRPRPADSGHRGRGIAMMHALGHDVTVETAGPGTRVGVSLRFPPAAAPTPDPCGPPPGAGGPARLHVHHDGDTVRLALSGELDLASLPTVRPALLAQLAGRGEVVLDLRGLTYLSSSGVGLLAEVMWISADGLRVLVRDGSPAARIVSLAGLDHLVGPGVVPLRADGAVDDRPDQHEHGLLRVGIVAPLAPGAGALDDADDRRDPLGDLPGGDRSDLPDRVR